MQEKVDEQIRRKLEDVNKQTQVEIGQCISESQTDLKSWFGQEIDNRLRYEAD